MALGNKNQKGGLIVLKPIFKVEGEYVTPFFQVRRKVDGSWRNDEEGVPSVSGDLTKIEVKENEYQGNKYKETVLYINDPQENEVYLVNLRFNLPSRSLFNSLLSLESPKNVSVSLYKDKKSGYGRYGLWQNNDTLVRWKYDLEDLPDVPTVTIGGKEQKDYFEVDEFYAKKLGELATRLLKQEPSDKPVAVGAEPEEDDDIPFR